MDMRLQNRHRKHRGTDLFSAMTVAVALLVIFFIGSAVCAIAAGGIPAFAGTIRQKEVLFALRLSAATASLRLPPLLTRAAKSCSVNTTSK